MVKFLKIMLWNANGLLNHKEELQAVFEIEKIDTYMFSY